jgi:murein DD-endopeptidase MepM/ murein hydrolase activator NlpD
MTAVFSDTYYNQEEWETDEEIFVQYEEPLKAPLEAHFPFDGMLLVAGGLVLFMLFNILRDRVQTGKDLSGAILPAAVSVAASVAPVAASAPEQEIAAAPLQDAAASYVYDPATLAMGGQLPFSAEEMAVVAAPYSKYTLTQGIHGASYGQAAIDLSAGKGADVLSPINGVVTGKYVDQYGNPTLIIENDLYTVTLLHGKYSAQVGELVALGQAVGVESNKGYTTDMAGRLCYGRAGCGYHTHLNIFDKRSGENANPLNLIR